MPIPMNLNEIRPKKKNFLSFSQGKKTKFDE